MPTAEFGGTEVDCEEGAILRDVLLSAGASPHNGRSSTVNCFGHGSCGTCAVDVEGETSDPTARERTRLSVPPHDPDDGLRLACQTRVLGDLEVRKGDGFWGQNVESLR